MQSCVYTSGVRYPFCPVKISAIHSLSYLPSLPPLSYICHTSIYVSLFCALFYWISNMSPPASTVSIVPESLPSTAPIVLSYLPQSCAYWYDCSNIAISMCLSQAHHTSIFFYPLSMFPHPSPDIINPARRKCTNLHHYRNSAPPPPNPPSPQRVKIFWVWLTLDKRESLLYPY